MVMMNRAINFFRVIVFTMFRFTPVLCELCVVYTLISKIFLYIFYGLRRFNFLLTDF